MELAILEGTETMNDIYNAYSKLAPNERAELLGRSLLRRAGSSVMKVSRATQKNVLRPSTHLAMTAYRNPLVKTGLNIAVPGSMTALNTLSTAKSLVRKIAPSSPALAQKIESQVSTNPSGFMTKMRKIAEQKRAELQEMPSAPPTPGFNPDESPLEKIFDKIPPLKTETSLDLGSLKMPLIIGGGAILALMLLKRK